VIPFDLQGVLETPRHWNDDRDERPKSWHVDLDDEAVAGEIAFLKADSSCATSRSGCRR